MRVLILNPRAGRGRGAKLRAKLERELPDFRVLSTRFSGEAEILAREAAKTGAKTVLAAGGDGTLGEVLNGVWPFRETTKIGVLPLGTGNDFARTLGFGTHLGAAISVAKNGFSRRVDVGEIEIGGQTRRFLNVCGTGFDALVAQRINAMSQGQFSRHLRGVGAYLCGVGAQLLAMESAPLELVLEGEKQRMSAVLCAIANAKSYGGGMLVAPHAQIDDGWLDVVVIEEVSRIEFLRAFPSVFRGAHLWHPRVHCFRAKSVEIHGERTLPVLVDGEICGVLPAKTQISPRAVEILAPSG